MPFDVAISRRTNTTAVLGRARWMQDGRAIAFIGQDERGVNGVFVQHFVPGRDTRRRDARLAGSIRRTLPRRSRFLPTARLLTIGGWEQIFNIIVASNVRGIERTARSGTP